MNRDNLLIENYIGPENCKFKNLKEWIIYKNEREKSFKAEILLEGTDL